ncbi:hypothetical protein P170DRAFT_449418 [Aspergillus steynii IBT 23096]|uniref:Altered inheritance of mitochondria protein 9, mitochondrial n=1 Tax=Aspergillus steynii IBT 23096 TaxID=1392250 RepID=A0A2I2FYU2_9EURO|nr:uncharacterized protein P170DRAFT_449418 [Aspergillus steynii IBT 23096]PLB45810.1 hypothetical protein P170DRAFT_449418 [Aspergillus steynii IBT 23096]
MQSLKKFFRRQPLCITVSIGKPISREDVFQYTNGRFLLDEETQLSKRYVRFDIDRLCDVISSIGGAEKSPVSKINKLEGGFSKALLMATENGSEYVVKIPCPNAGRPKYCTASEVAVLNFVRSRTSIPAPRAISWSSDVTNPVGAEYIVMEKVPGVQMFKKWDEMGESNRIPLIKRLTQWECELSAIKLPAYGSLYYGSSLPGSEAISLDPSMDPEGEFCIGPACDSSWLRKTLSDMGKSLIERSIFRARGPSNTHLPAYLRDSPDNHLVLLDMAKRIMPIIGRNSKLLEKSQPTLWHTDLRMGNIFVSEKKPDEVTGFIDWQNTSVYPRFLQARFPVFLAPPKGYQEGLVMSKLPPDFEQMDSQHKELAMYNKTKATWTKAYEKATKAPMEIKELFRRCGETWEEGLIPLREVMIEIFLGQEDLEFPTKASPVSFTDEEITQHKEALSIYTEWHEMRSFAKEVLDTDDEGWVAPERDFDEIRSRNEMLPDYYISTQVSTRAPNEVKRTWPFPTHV